MFSLAYSSSRLEGNTYTEIDAATLLDDGFPCAENCQEETKMLINHKHALDFLGDANVVDRNLISNLHARLANDEDVTGSGRSPTASD